jgi:HEAT repeat protein
MQSRGDTMGLFGSSPKVEDLKANRDVPGLIKALNNRGTDSKAEETRKAAALALGEIRDPMAVQPLIAAQAQVTARVRQVVENSAVTSNVGRMAYSLNVLKALQTAGEMRQIIVVALGRIGGPLVVQALIANLAIDYKSVREAAAEALGEIGDPQAIEPLVAARDAARSNEKLANDNIDAALSKLGVPAAN